MLRRAGYADVTVFERGDRVGGVWHHNAYPGAACDVPSHLYEFSFEPNPRWSRRYAPQAEIQAYLEDVARRHGVLGGIRTGTEVKDARWDEERSRWVLETGAGSHEAEVLITACGQLSVPKVPPIPGLERFERGAPRPGGTGSVIYTIEAGMSHVIAGLDRLGHAGASRIELRPQAAEAFDRELRAALAGSVWHTGCTSWYVDENGNDPNQWPWLWSSYRRRTARLDPNAYHLSAPGA